MLRIPEATWHFTFPEYDDFIYMKPSLFTKVAAFGRSLAFSPTFLDLSFSVKLLSERIFFVR